MLFLKKIPQISLFSQTFYILTELLNIKNVIPWALGISMTLSFAQNLHVDDMLNCRIKFKNNVYL